MTPAAPQADSPSIDAQLTELEDKIAALMAMAADALAPGVPQDERNSIRKRLMKFLTP